MVTRVAVEGRNRSCHLLDISKGIDMFIGWREEKDNSKTEILKKIGLI